MKNRDIFDFLYQTQYIWDAAIFTRSSNETQMSEKMKELCLFSNRNRGNLSSRVKYLIVSVYL